MSGIETWKLCFAARWRSVRAQIRHDIPRNLIREPLYRTSPPRRRCPSLRLIYDRDRSDVTLLAVVVVAVASSFVLVVVVVLAVAFPLLPKVEIALEAVTVVTAASEKSFWQINRGKRADGMHAAAAAGD